MFHAVRFYSNMLNWDRDVTGRPLAWPNHLGCPQFEDLAPMMSPRFVHQESELLNNCVNQILCQGRKKGEAVEGELL